VEGRVTLLVAILQKVALLQTNVMRIVIVLAHLMDALAQITGITILLTEIVHLLAHVM
jgi:hypothetical protein